MTAFSTFVVNWFLKDNLRNFEYRLVLLFGCGALTLRLFLIRILLNFTDNIWALGSTDFLDSFGTVSLDPMLTLYSHLSLEKLNVYVSLQPP